MRYVLTFDPGLTTGWAILDYDGMIVQCGNLLEETVLEKNFLRDMVDRLAREYNIAEVIVEEMPPGSPGDRSRRLEAVRQKLTTATGLFQVRYVNPSTWKTSRGVLTAPRFDRWDDAPVTPHQRDAVGIARWWLNVREDQA